VNNTTTPAGTAHAGSRLNQNNHKKAEMNNIKNSVNQIDAFTDFINEWIDCNVKVFTRGGKHDGEVL
jgi:hypothetical protein